MLLAGIVGYLLGAIPIGLIVGRLVGRVDLRDHGSRRTGTTNALRVLGPVPAGIVLLLDIAKGAAAVVAGAWLAGGSSVELGAAVAGAAAIVGHTWSVFIGFGGGRGVATAGGALLAVTPLTIAVVVPIMLAVAWATRYVSLASIVGAVLAPIATGFLSLAGLASREAVGLAVAAALLIVIRHADNIDRLRRGTERRLGHSEPAGPS